MQIKFFITGQPRSGKSTLILEITKELNLKAGGFFTSEINEKGERVGFNIVSLDGKRGILAHKNFKSQFAVGKYKVSIEDLEEIGVKSILNAFEAKRLIIIDEVGKMEMFSDKFKAAVLAALESDRVVLGTIKLTTDPFTDEIKRRSDTEIFCLGRDNFKEVKKKIKDKLLALHRRNKI